MKVLDLSRALAGPYCTMLLGDMGADVLKLEQPGEGDESRSWGPPFVGEESSYFLSVNRNKRSLTLNLKDQQGKEIFHRLVHGADALVENFRVGTMERLGVGYEALQALNPRLIYASISGFGRSGPYALRAGYDQIAQGMSGMMSITGPDGGEPTKVGVAIGDIVAGMFAFQGILLALLYRGRSGQGQLVDVSLLDGQIALLTYQAGRYLTGGQVPRPAGNNHPLIAPYGAYRAADGYVNICCGNDALWEKLCHVLGTAEWLADPRFRSNKDRVKCRMELAQLIDERLAARPAAYWAEQLSAAGVPAGPIYTLDQVFSDQQVLHREMVLTVPHPTAGQVRVTGIPVKLSDSPGAVRLPPPLLGQHTDQVLSELGYAQEQIAQLRSGGVV
ncbi:MAG: CoA transferase [Deinococcus sp.]|nr:CoA transferase [Deinococcus sp.]